MKKNEGFIKQLEGQIEVSLTEFLSKFKGLTSYPERESYLSEVINKEVLDIIKTDEFTELYYVDSQAEHLMEKLRDCLTDLDTFKTMVFCYNTNLREFKDKAELKVLETDLFSRGFKKYELTKLTAVSPAEGPERERENELKELSGLNGICVLDVNCMGLLGSFDKKKEIEGNLVYSEYQKSLMLIPKRSRTKGFVIRGDFYFKKC